MFGLTLVVLVGFLGLSLDLGRLYIAKTELQNSADACALAAAQALTTANTLQASEAAGMTVGMRNAVLLQSEPVVLTADSSITFSNTLNGTYETKGNIAPSAARFVRCTTERAEIPTWFMHVLNLMPGASINPNTVRASAVASLVSAQTNCALPVAICSTFVPPSTLPGTWIEGVIGPSGGQSSGAGGLTGNFRWIDFSPPQGGAAELGRVLTGPGTCNLPSTGTEVGQLGVVASASSSWNSRFGIYRGNVTPEEAVPDFTGYAYTEINWPTRFDALTDFRSRRTVNAPYQGDTTTGLRTNGTISSSTFLTANGADRRLAIAPIVDCGGFASGSTAPVLDWACVLMLHPLNINSGGAGTGSERMFLEYRGRANEIESPCASLGVPGQRDVSLGPQVPALFQ